MLVKFGANPYLKNKSKKSLFDEFQKKNFSPDIRFKNQLLKEYEKNCLVLFNSIENNNAELIREFVKKNSVGIFDKNSNNPLHIASINNNFEIFKLILSIRPSLIGQKNNEGKLPIEINLRMIFQFYIDKNINFVELIKNNNK